MSYISVQQAAGLLHVHPNTIRNWIKNGVLPSFQLNPGYRILLRTEDIDRLFDKGSSDAKRHLRKKNS